MKKIIIASILFGAVSVASADSGWRIVDHITVNDNVNPPKPLRFNCSHDPAGNGFVWRTRQEAKKAAMDCLNTNSAFVTTKFDDETVVRHELIVEPVE